MTAEARQDSAPRSGSTSPRSSILTLFAIGALAWMLSNTGHELLGHAATCQLQGNEVRYVSSSFAFCANEAASPMESRIQLAAGTLFNLALAALAWTLARHPRRLSPASHYFLWLIVAMNIFYSGSYVAGWFLGPTLDWNQFLVGLEPPLAWRAGMTLTGVAVIAFGLHLSRVGLTYFAGGGPGSRLRSVVLTIVPYLAAIVVKLSSAVQSTVSDTALVLLGAFGVSGMFLVWLPLLPLWPVRTAASREPVAVPFAPTWLAAALVVAAFYIVVLGHGIGEVPADLASG